MSPLLETFASLHVPGRPFLLVNAWDVASALALAAAGHPAVGTTSLGVTAAAGLLDGHGQGKDLTRSLGAALAARLPVPVTVDLEDGYSDDPVAVAELVAELAASGVVGVNLEDAARRAAGEHARVVATVKERVPGVFVNARADEYWSGGRSLSATLERCRAYRDAGADGLFVPGLQDLAALEQVVAVGPPVNTLYHPAVHVASVGVARISTGSLLYRHSLAAAVDAAAAAREGRRLPGTPMPYEGVQALL